MTAIREAKEIGQEVALDSLKAALAQDWARANAEMSRLEDCSLVAWIEALWSWLMLAWDAAGSACPDCGSSQCHIALSWIDVRTGKDCGADEVLPAIAWAGRLIAAGCAGDVASFDALMGVFVAIDDIDQRAEHAASLLMSVVQLVVEEPETLR